MQSIQPLLKLWRKWFNRNKLFKTDEMNELESHLLDEIDYIKEHDKLSEEQAFQKAVQLIGQRESLDQEYEKNHGFTYPKFAFWFRNHTLQLFVASLLIIAFLVVDFQFSQSHTRNNMILEKYDFKNMHPILKFEGNSTFNFKISYIKNFGFKNQTIVWDINQDPKDPIIPLYYCPIDIFGKGYFAVLDNNKRLWIENSNIFTEKSTQMKLVTNTNWSIWNDNLQKELSKKSKISNNNVYPSYPNMFETNTFYFNSLLSFNEYSGSDENLSIGKNDEIINNFITIEEDGGLINFCYIKFRETEYSSLFLITAPYLSIEKIQVERKPLHMLPFLYQKITGFFRSCGVFMR